MKLDEKGAAIIAAEMALQRAAATAIQKHTEGALEGNVAPKLGNSLLDLASIIRIADDRIKAAGEFYQMEDDDEE